MTLQNEQIRFARIAIHARLKSLRLSGVITRDEQSLLGDELMAQLVAAWPRFDPARAAAEAFINQVVDTRLVSLLRARGAAKRAGSTVPLDQIAEGSLREPQRSGHETSHAGLRLDLAEAMELLTPREREIVDELMRESLTPAARNLGVPRSTLRDQVERIRVVFRDIGLDAYLES